MDADLVRLHQRIDALEASIVEMRKRIGDQLLLVERNQELRRALGAREKVYPRAWRLVRQESLFLSSLMAGPGGFRSFEQLAAAMFVGVIAPSVQGVHVVASRLRAKLRRLEVEIVNENGLGYRLPVTSRRKIEAAMKLEE